VDVFCANLSIDPQVLHLWLSAYQTIKKPLLLTSNFAHLQEHDEQLLRLGMLAERYFPDDPNTSLLKLRQLAELLAQLVATTVGLYQSPEESQYDLLRRLQEQGILPREIAQLFAEVRRAGNVASHAVAGDHHTALAALKITWQLGLWFHRTLLMQLARELNELSVARTHPNPYFEHFANALARRLGAEPEATLSKEEIEAQARLADEVLEEVIAEEEAGETGEPA
jgi:hypothetical protein